MEQLQLQRIQAAAHPGGNRVDLRWYNPDPRGYTGVRVMRRESTHPTSPFDGQLVSEVSSTPLFNISEGIVGIKNELARRELSPELAASFAAAQLPLTTEAVVSIVETGKRWEVSDGDRLFLVAAANGDLAIYGMSTTADTGLRAEVVYYYMLFPYRGDPPEYAIHANNRAAVMVTGPYDFAGEMYRLLPRIYHRYDVVLPIDITPGMSEADKKRGQLRRFLDLPGQSMDQLYSFAAAVLELHNCDRVHGQLLPLLAQWIGWKSDFNLEISGQRNELRSAPSLYEMVGTIPAAVAAIGKCIRGWKSRPKEFVHNVFLSNRPERLNLWECRRTGAGQWRESGEVFSLDFAYDGRLAAAGDGQGKTYLFYHTQRNQRWETWYKTYQKDEGWAPSQPFAAVPGKTVNKNPSAALQGDTLWVFWESYHEDEQTWRINCRKQTGGTWGSIDTTVASLPGGSQPRKSPRAVVDDQKRLWLFWLEKDGSNWQLKYNRYDGNTWEIDPAADFPAEVSGDNPRVEKDLFVFYQAEGPHAGIWVFWARKTISAGIRGSWEIAARRKSDINNITGDWRPVRTLTKDPPGEYSDCEPAAANHENDRVLLVWSSNRTGTWTLWSVDLKEIDTAHPHSEEILSSSPYSRRSPLPLRIDDRVTIVFRSNRDIFYKSPDYSAVETTDFRYAGSLTVDTGNTAMIDLQEDFGDIRAYTHDCGEKGKLTNDDWYTRGTIGLYLAPDTEDQQLIARNQEYIKDVLEKFLPLQIRAVFIKEQEVDG